MMTLVSITCHLKLSTLLNINKHKINYLFVHKTQRIISISIYKNIYIQGNIVQDSNNKL